MSTGEIPRTTPSTASSIILHAVSVAVFSNGFRMMLSGPFFEFFASQVGGPWQYLTNLGLAAALGVSLSALLKDLLPSITLLDRLKMGLGVIAVPLSAVISLIYWGITFYKPELMLPPDMELYLPKSLDLSIHAAPALFLWLDFLFFSPPFSKKIQPLIITCIVALFYSIWVEYCAYHNKQFPYPFLNLAQPIQRVGIYAGAALMNYGLFHLANWIHFRVDGLMGKDVKTSKKQAQGKLG